MAAPHVAGLVALMLDKNPEVTRAEILDCLQSTSSNGIDGIVNAYDAIDCVPSPPCQGKCGDANADGTVNSSDIVYIINYVFIGGDQPQPVIACGDANTDATVNVSDAVKILIYVFTGGTPPSDCSPGNWENQGGDCCPFAPKSYHSLGR